MLAVFCFLNFVENVQACLFDSCCEKKKKREKSFHQFLLVQQCYGAAKIPPRHVTFQVVSKVTEAPVF